MSRNIALLVLSFFLVAGDATAQSTDAIITGRVLDPVNAVIAGAEVAVINLNTAVRYTGTTNGEGVYLVSNIQPGVYRVEVSKVGFKTVLKPDMILHVQDVVVLNFALSFGSVMESITVRGGAPLFSSAPGSTGAVIEGRQVNELPLNGRNFTQLALLTPGVTRGPYSEIASGVNNAAETHRYGDSGGAALSVNGLRTQSNNFILDGMDNNESLVNTIIFFPPAEAIQEFRVSTSVAPAEFGRAGGAIVGTSIRSGTNQIHGSVFDFLRNSALDANDAYFGTPDPTTGKAPKLPFRRNQFGATFGLPIVKNRLFLFADYQGLRSERYREPEFATVPTLLMRQGNFSELLDSGLTTTPDPTLTGCTNVALVNGAIYDPLSCAPFPGNIIPGARMNPVAFKYLNAFPLPNLSGRIKKNYEAQRQDIRNFDDFDARVDGVLSNKDLFFARFSYAQDSFRLTPLLSTLPSGFGSGYNPAHPRGMAAGYVRKFSASVVSDVRLGYTRDLLAYEPPFGNIPLAQQLGIPNANRTPQLGGGALIGGNNDELETTGDGGPYVVPEYTQQGNGAVSWMTGRHTLHFGANLLRRGVDFFQGNLAKGYFVIGGTNYPGTGRFTGYEVAELLAGFTDYEIGAGQAIFKTSGWETGYYAQDDWRMTNRLALNLGVRYDLYTYPTEKQNRQSNFDLATARLVLPGQNGLPNSLVRTDRNNWAPRIGLAYDIRGTRQSVVRGGYGIFYFLDRGGVGNQLSNNPDFNGVSTYKAIDGYRFALSGAAPNGTNDNRLATGPLPPAAPVIDRNAPRNTTVIAVPPKSQNSMVQQWNVQFEQQLDEDTALSLAYAGNKADHLMTWFNLNNQILNTPFGISLYPGTGLVVTVGSASGTARYDGLQTQLKRRFSRNLQYTLSYTWSHTRDNSNGPFSVTGGGGRIFDFPGTGGDLALNWGNSDQDQRHFFTLSTLYELPFGDGKRFGYNWTPFLNAIAGGWQWNNIVTLGTGTPFDVAIYGNPSNRPDYIGIAGSGQMTPLNEGIRWINYSAFAAPPTNATGVFTRPGTLGRNYFHGPGVKTWDLSLLKNFDLTERLKLQFRAEGYNIFNTPQFAPPNSNWNAGPKDFGVIRNTRAFAERQVQIALRLVF